MLLFYVLTKDSKSPLKITSVCSPPITGSGSSYRCEPPPHLTPTLGSAPPPPLFSFNDQAQVPKLEMGSLPAAESKVPGPGVRSPVPGGHQHIAPPGSASGQLGLGLGAHTGPL